MRHAVNMKGEDSNSSLGAKLYMRKRQRKPYEQGREAAERGWDRISPYTRILAEKYWYDGFDSVKSNNAVGSPIGGKQS